MRATRYLPVLAPIMVLLLLTGCGGTKGGSGGELEGVKWVLGSYTSQGTMQEVPADMRIDAFFERGKVSGSSGINTYASPYQLSGASLTIGPAATTMMAGQEAAMEIEQAYLASLQEAASFTSTGDTLVIFDKEGGEILSYVKEEAASLTGVTWIVTGYNNGKGGVVSPIAGVELTAIFSEEGKVSGSSGVNTFNGEYSLEGLKITIGPLATTLMASGDAAAVEQETEYLAALQSAARFTIEDYELELRRADGALAVSFAAR